MLFLVSCENDVAEVEQISSKKLGVEEARQVEIIYTLTGHTKSILKAPLMYRVQDSIPYIEFPRTIHVDFYNPLGQKESKLDALYARYKETQSLIYIRDSVRVINMLEGDTLICEELFWDQNRRGREFYTDKPVRIRTPTQVIDGIGMESGQDFKNWSIKHPRGNIQVPASSFPE